MKPSLSIRSKLGKSNPGVILVHHVPNEGEDRVVLGRYMTHKHVGYNSHSVEVVTKHGHGVGLVKTKGKVDYVEVTDFEKRKHFDYSLVATHLDSYPLSLLTTADSCIRRNY